MQQNYPPVPRFTPEDQRELGFFFNHNGCLEVEVSLRPMSLHLFGKEPEMLTPGEGVRLQRLARKVGTMLYTNYQYGYTVSNNSIRITTTLTYREPSWWYGEPHLPNGRPGYVQLVEMFEPEDETYIAKEIWSCSKYR